MRQCQISWLYCLISYIKMEPQCITFFFYVAPFIPCWVISIAFRIKRYGFCCHWLLWACGFSRNRHSLRLRLFITLDFIAVFSSCLGTSSAVLFRLRATRSDLSSFSSSSVLHCFEMMASRWGTSAFRLAVLSSYWAMMPDFFFRTLTKSMHSKINYFGQRKIALTNKIHFCSQFVSYKA